MPSASKGFTSDYTKDPNPNSTLTPTSTSDRTVFAEYRRDAMSTFEKVQLQCPNPNPNPTPLEGTALALAPTLTPLEGTSCQLRVHRLRIHFPAMKLDPQA